MDVKASAQTFHCMDPLLSGQFHSPNEDISTCFSPSLYLSLAQMLLSNCKHKLPCAEDFETERKNFSPSTCARWSSEFTQTGATCQSTKAGVFSKPAYVCPYAYVVYVLCLTEASSKQLSLTFTPSANTFLNP